MRGDKLRFAALAAAVFILLILISTWFNPIPNEHAYDESVQITLVVNFDGRASDNPTEWVREGDIWVEIPGNSSGVIFHNLTAETPFEALKAACGIAQWNLQYENYSYGKLVVSVNGHDNGDGGAYWQYWVNGVYASVSSDSFTLAGGDILVWAFSSYVSYRNGGV